MSTQLIKPEWSPLTIGLMVLGFIVFWPLGMAMLFYILWGEHWGGSSDKAEKWMHKQKHKMKGCRGKRYRSQATGNAAFDEYREAEFRRIDEERARLEEERAEFEEFLRNLHMARDREEFDRFKSDHRAKRHDDEDDRSSRRDDRKDRDDY